MIEDEYLDARLLCSTKRIRALRRADETFDAICTDYISLSGEIARAAAEGDPGAARFLEDARDSLSGLAKEIEARLRSFHATDESDT